MIYSISVLRIIPRGIPLFLMILWIHAMREQGTQQVNWCGVELWSSRCCLLIRHPLCFRSFHVSFHQGKERFLSNSAEFYPDADFCYLALGFRPGMRLGVIYEDILLQASNKFISVRLSFCPQICILQLLNLLLPDLRGRFKGSLWAKYKVKTCSEYLNLMVTQSS